MHRGLFRYFLATVAWLPVVFMAGTVGCKTGSSKNSADAPQTRGPIQVSNSYYELSGHSGRVIVFVHGIFGSSNDTWRCSPSVSWPSLLKDDPDPALRDTDIYLAGYDTPYSGNTMTIDEIVSNLKSRLDNDRVFSGHREVVFVAHSMGGLIVQRLLLTHRELSAQVPFIYFYSTPETGAQIAKIGHMVNGDPLLKEMFPGDSNDYLLNLEREWQNARFSIHRYCAYEKKSLDGVLVVGTLSGTRNCEQSIAINENHATIVKPCNLQSDSYIALRNALRNTPIKPVPAPVNAVAPTVPQLPPPTRPAKPLPSGSAIVFDGFNHYGQSTFIFDGGEVSNWGSKDADLGVSNPSHGEQASFFLMNNHAPYTDPNATNQDPANAGIIDMHTRDLDSVQEAPLTHYVANYFDPQVGHVYCIRMRDGRHFGKLVVTDIEKDRVAFDWVFQPNGTRLLTSTP